MTVAKVLVKTLFLTYSSGSVQEFHLIPSSSDIPRGISETNADAKIHEIFEKMNTTIFFSEQLFSNKKKCIFADLKKLC
jgi:hypothetical protein